MPKSVKLELPIRPRHSSPALAPPIGRAGRSRRSLPGGLPGPPISPFRAGRGSRQQRSERARQCNASSLSGVLGPRDGVDGNPLGGGDELGVIIQRCPVEVPDSLPAGQTAALRAKLKTAESRILDLEKRMSTSHRREQRLKKALEGKGELLKDAQGEVQEARTQVVMAEERIDVLEARSQGLKKDLVKYKGWWLTDYHSLKVVVGLLPSPDYVHDIVMSSKARFESYSAAL